MSSTLSTESPFNRPSAIHCCTTTDSTGPYTPRTEEWSKLVFPPVTDTAGARGHADNLTNFADRGLADAIEALTSE